MTLLDVAGLNVRFPTEDGVVHAVRDVSFTVAPGEVLGIVGESGSGKSVTSLAVMGLLPRSAGVEGSIRYNGRDLQPLPPKERMRFRGRDMGMVFQDPMSSLNPVYTVGWQLDEAIRAHNAVSRRAARARSIELLERVQIPNARDRVNAYPHEFSGGMRQRVVIAIAMANAPRLLIADEPTTALDVTVQAEILDMIAAVSADTGVSVMLITHDLGVVARMAKKVFVMYAGTIVESGDIDTVFYSPRMPYTGGLLGSIPRVTSDGTRLNQIKGSTPSLIEQRPGCPFSARCPMVLEQCRRVTPKLEPTDSPSHLAACHRWRELVDIDAAAMFVGHEATHAS